MKLFLQPDPSDTWEQIHAAVFDLEAALKVEVVAVIGADAIELILPPAPTTAGLVAVPAVEPAVTSAPPVEVTVKPLPWNASVTSGSTTVQGPPPPIAPNRPTTKTATTPGLVACPDCAKQVKPAGLGIHRAKAHGTPGATTVRPDGTPLAGPSDRLTKAAKVYADAQATGHNNPVGAVATALDTNAANARQLISRARKNGLLPRADGKPNDAA